jgi:hypothetical protein
MVSGHRHNTIVVTGVATDELPVARGGESLCLDSRSARQVLPCWFPHPELVHRPPSVRTHIDHVSTGLVITSGVVNPVDVLSIPRGEAFQLAVLRDGCYVPPGIISFFTDRTVEVEVILQRDSMIIKV